MIQLRGSGLGPAAEAQCVTAWVPEVPLCAGPDVVVPVGGQYRSIVRVTHCAHPNCSPKFTVAPIPGLYRIVWIGVADPAAKEVLPLEQRVSNTFTLLAGS